MTKALYSAIPLLSAAVLLTTLWINPPSDTPRLPPSSTSKMYVSSFGSGTIAVYDSTGTYSHAFSADGLSGSRGVVFGPNNRIYVASQHSDEIFAFDEEDQMTMKFSDPELDGPTGMAISPSNELFIGSYNNDKVVVFKFCYCRKS